jgi:hypothetical protein
MSKRLKGTPGGRTSPTSSDERRKDQWDCPAGNYGPSNSSDDEFGDDYYDPDPTQVTVTTLPYLPADSEEFKKKEAASAKKKAQRKRYKANKAQKEVDRLYAQGFNSFKHPHLKPTAASSTTSPSTSGSPSTTK